MTGWTYWDVQALPARTFRTLLTMLQEEERKRPKRKPKGQIYSATSE